MVVAPGQVVGEVPDGGDRSFDEIAFFVNVCAADGPGMVEVRLEAIGGSIKTWLNGVSAADLKDSKTSTGFIALQVHNIPGDEPLQVRWRNIRIRELD